MYCCLHTTRDHTATTRFGLENWVQIELWNLKTVGKADRTMLNNDQIKLLLTDLFERCLEDGMTTTPEILSIVICMGLLDNLELLYSRRPKWFEISASSQLLL